MALTDAEIVLIALDLRFRDHDDIGPDIAEQLTTLSASARIELDVLSDIGPVHPATREVAATSRYVARRIGDPEEDLLAQEVARWT